MDQHNDPLVPFSTRVPASLRKTIRYEALMADRDVQDVAREALEEWIIRHAR